MKKYYFPNHPMLNQWFFASEADWVCLDAEAVESLLIRLGYEDLESGKAIWGEATPEQIAKYGVFDSEDAK